MANFRSLTLQNGIRTNIQDANSLVVGAGILTSTGDLSITAASGTLQILSDTHLAANKNITLAAGTGIADFSNGSGIFKTTTGTVTIGPGAVGVSGATTFSAAGTALTVTNNTLLSGTATITGAAFANGGLDRSTGATLAIGGTNATEVDIGRTGQLTKILGNLQVQGTETVIGTSLFTDAVTFDGTVTVGDGTGVDTFDFNPTSGRFSSAANPDVKWLKENDHQFIVDASTTTDAVGGKLSILSGNGTGAGNGGIMLVDAGSGAAGGVLQLGVTNASAISVGHSGATTTITGGLTQLTGAVSITANAASSLTSSSGAFTITSAAAATWKTAAGALTVDGKGGLNLQSNDTTMLAFDSGAANITVQGSMLLTTTGSGNINLPNNGSARFQVEGAAVGSTVTAANFNTFTNGSNADALHFHTTGVSTNIGIPGTSGEAIAAGAPTAYKNVAGAPQVFNADANGAGTLTNVFGISNTTVASSGLAVTVYVTGERAIPDTIWDAVPAVTDVGSFVYLSENVGKLTLTPPSTTGSYVTKIGVVSVGGTGAVKIAIGVGDANIA